MVFGFHQAKLHTVFLESAFAIDGEINCYSEAENLNY